MPSLETVNFQFIINITAMFWVGFRPVFSCQISLSVPLNSNPKFGDMVEEAEKLIDGALYNIDEKDSRSHTVLFALRGHDVNLTLRTLFCFFYFIKKVIYNWSKADMRNKLWFKQKDKVNHIPFSTYHHIVPFKMRHCVESSESVGSKCSMSMQLFR